MRYVMVICHIKCTKVLRKFYEKCITIMATFKAVVMRHQKRRDGKYPVSIRLTHNKKSTYLSTGLYVSGKQINSKTFEIKDQFVLERTNNTIRDYERFLLEQQERKKMQKEKIREIHQQRARSQAIRKQRDYDKKVITKNELIRKIEEEEERKTKK